MVRTWVFFSSVITSVLNNLYLLIFILSNCIFIIYKLLLYKLLLFFTLDVCVYCVHFVARKAALEYNMETSNQNAPTILRVVANTPTVHNVIVCTLCSCYPVGLLGFSPSWYKSRAYRSRVVREPRKVLSEFGLEIPTTTTIRVHDSTADVRYFVLPLPPSHLTDADIQKMSHEELKALISRDSMIGVAVL